MVCRFVGANTFTVETKYTTSIKTNIGNINLQSCQLMSARVPMRLNEVKFVTVCGFRFCSHLSLLQHGLLVAFKIMLRSGKSYHPETKFRIRSLVLRVTSISSGGCETFKSQSKTCEKSHANESICTLNQNRSGARCVIVERCKLQSVPISQQLKDLRYWNISPTVVQHRHSFPNPFGD